MVLKLGQTEQPGDLVREVNKNLMVTRAKLQRSCEEMREASRRTTVNVCC